MAEENPHQSPDGINSVTAGLPARFSLGKVVATRNALSQIDYSDILSALHRHMSGDWGELDKEDTQANNEALVHGTRLLSAYRSRKGVKFWIITEADRSVTTVLLPEDY